MIARHWGTDELEVIGELPLATIAAVAGSLYQLPLLCATSIVTTK